MLFSIWNVLGAVLPAAAFVHPGLLHTAADFERITSNVDSAAEPWSTAWNKLISSPYADSGYSPQAVPVVYRGSDGTNAENYQYLYEDIAAAYALAVCWKVTGDSTYGDAAIKILDAWSSTLTALGGDSDQYLASGIYGYEFAQAGEIMRDYSAWDNFDAFVAMMVDVFYVKVNDWFVNHDAGEYAQYAPGVYANWDLCNMASAMAIGVLSDNETMYDQGYQWFFDGPTNGQINRVVPYLHVVDGQILGQTQESGRDQGHGMLEIALLGPIGLMAYNQGDDSIMSNNNSIILSAAEYMAKYNLGHDVPYTAYSNGQLDLPTISATDRGDQRPIWELLYNHYGALKGLNVTWTGQYRDAVNAANGGAEGGSGDYGSTSGGYDQLGWGTLMYTLNADA